jgi:hypothetical protein
MKDQNISVDSLYNILTLVERGDLPHSDKIISVEDVDALPEHFYF